MIAVRPAQPQDLAAIRRLVADAGGHDAAARDPGARGRLGAALRDPTARVLVAADGEVVVGVAHLQVRSAVHTAATEGWVAFTAVAPDRRRSSVGTALLEAVDREARLLGCDELVLESGRERSAAHAFWEAAGFVRGRPAERFRRAVVAPPEDAPLVERFLAAAGRACVAVAGVLAEHTDPDEVALGADGAPTTSADRAAERAAIGALQGLGLPIVSEEAGLVGPAPGAGEPWIALDPLDGTRNFRSGCPPYAVAVGLVRDGRAAVGYVVDLSSGRRWWGGEQIGAWADGRPIRVRRGRLIGVPSVRSGARFTSPALPHAERLRMSGSSAVDVCRVADGSYSAFWGSARAVLRGHDLAAGLAIAQAAGAVVRTVPQRPLRLRPDPTATYAVVLAADPEDADRLLGFDPRV